MNHSSLFSFEESSAWDPKVIRKRLVVSQDQLIKLNSIPGWTKVQDNEDTLRLGTDFSIQSSQLECSVYVTQNNERIKNNTKLFNEQIENRKSILKKIYNKVYENKLTRSLSLFAIDKNCENLNIKTLKRTVSLQSVHQSSNASDINAFKYIRCEKAAKKQSPLDFNNKTILQRQLDYIILPTQCKTSHSESLKSKELFLSRQNSEIMETISQLPVNVPTTIEKPIIKESNGMLPAEKAGQPIKHVVDLHPETSKESNNVVLADNVDLHSETVKKDNGVSPVENIHSQSNNMPDQLKHVTQFMNDKSDSHSETTKDSNDVLSAVNVTQCTNVSNEAAKPVNNTSSVNNSVSALKNLAESCVPVVDGSHKTDLSSVKEIQTYKIPVFANEKAASSLNVQQEGKFPISHLSNANETNSLIVKEIISENCSTSISNTDDVPPNPPENIKPSASIVDECRPCLSKSPAKYKSAEKFPIPNKELGTEHLIGNCTSDMNVNDSGSDIKMESGKNDEKECDPAKYVKVKSVENDQKDESSSAKKRKLESRNKRSKKHKSEEKQGTLKIRSIKKVGEICYSVEEVKTMLDIMKQFS